MCIFRNGDKLLFSRGYDTVKKETFLRPLGGHMEFEESAEDTIRREMQEEIDSKIADLRLLSTFEHRFTYKGKPRHEIIFMFEGTLLNTSLYTQEHIIVQEGNGEGEAGWFSKADVEKEALPIYPLFDYFT